MKRFLMINTIFLFLIFCFPAFAQTDSTYVIGSDSTVVKPEQTKVFPVPILNESNSFILNKWEINEYKENGKVQELPNYEIEFFEDGTYTAIEEEEFDNGTWNLSPENSKLIFDDNTPNREEWNIISFDANKIVFRFTDEGKTYEYTFNHWVKKVE